MSTSRRAINTYICSRGGLSAAVVPGARRARLSVIHTASRGSARAYSAESLRSPSNKISAVPFRITPEIATERLYSAGLVASSKLGNVLLAILQRIFGNWITAPAQEYGLGQGLTLNDVKAVYYPVWRCDAIFEGTVTNELKLDGGGEQAKGWVGLRGGYVPGNPFEPLSYLSFAVPPLEDELPVYDPVKDLKQLGNGYDVVPIPFTVTPFDLVKKIRQDMGVLTIWEALTVHEDRWTEKMLACYPVMFPIYIADFTFENSQDDSRRFQIVLDAHDSNIKNCRVSFPLPPEMIERMQPRNYYANPAPFIHQSQIEFVLPMIQPMLIPSRGMAAPNHFPPTGKDLSEVYNTYMSPPPQPELMPPSPLVEAHRNFAHPDGIDWTDQRIQSWSSDTRDENLTYVDAMLEYARGATTLQTLNNMPQGAEAHSKGIIIEVDKNDSGGNEIPFGVGT
ncbi:hypothetical protein BCR39DRAFT_599686 [Naematelia encephala]|uniref:Uncharacterized protein n=1 Tax=Naematelia encephala TaxID=71784 RepID=A0A1Y2AVT1_9TREE|nr:hypothetical protein BCR39DRAFT_599686 [Naematelia encephala]